jgi:polygalacturonase/pectin methylesterase-like acyl-CoA thioesterase
MYRRTAAAKKAKKVLPFSAPRTARRLAALAMAVCMAVPAAALLAPGAASAASAAGVAVNFGAAPSGSNFGQARYGNETQGAFTANANGTLSGAPRYTGAMPLPDALNDKFVFAALQVPLAEGPYKVTTYVSSTTMANNAASGAMIRAANGTVGTTSADWLPYAASVLRFDNTTKQYAHSFNYRTAGGANAQPMGNITPQFSGASSPQGPYSVTIGADGQARIYTPASSSAAASPALAGLTDIWIGLECGRYSATFYSARITKGDAATGTDASAANTLWQTDSLATPANGAATLEGGGTELTWDAVANASRYRVESPLGTPIGTTASTSYAVSGENAATYYIIAENATDGAFFPSDGQYLNNPPLEIAAAPLVGPFDVTYSANGGTGAVPAAAAYDEGESVSVAFSPAPTKRGNVFLGWSPAPAVDGDPAYKVYEPDTPASFTMAKGAVQLNAMWARNIYFNLNGGTGSAESRYVTVGTAVGALPSGLEKKDSVFGGWAAEPGGGGAYSPSTVVGAGDALTLYAVWRGPYEVSYDANGGTGDVPISGEFPLGANIGVEFDPLPAKSGNRFLGWSPAPAVDGEPAYAEGATESFALGDGPVRLNAIWARRVAFDFGAGTGSAPERYVAVGAAVGELPDPGEVEGMSFGGWADAPQGGAVYTADTAVAAGDALTLHARWKSPPTGKSVISVEQDGSGDFMTVTEAIGYLTENGLSGLTVSVGPGTFREKITVKIPLTLIGAGSDKTAITWNDGNQTPFRADDATTVRDPEYLYPSIYPGGPAGPAPNGSYGTMGSYTAGFFPGAEGSAIKNIAVTNTATGVGQTVALNFSCDRLIADGVRLDAASSDTFLIHDGRAYVVNSEINGSTDFIFGNGQAVINNCDINVKTTGGYVFAPATDASAPFGFLAMGNTVTFQGSGNASLGRAWEWGQTAKQPEDRYVVSAALLAKGNVLNGAMNAAAFANGTKGGTPQSMRIREWGSSGSATPSPITNATRLACQADQAMADAHTAFSVFGTNGGLYAEPWIPYYDGATTPATQITNVSITSDSGYQDGGANTMAYGNTVKLTFDTTEKLFPMSKPVIDFWIGGRNVSEAVPFVSEIAENRYEATFKANFGDHVTGTDTTYAANQPEYNVNFGGLDGLVTFSITGVGINGYDISPVTATGDGTSVVLDRALPSIPDAPVVPPAGNPGDPYWDDEVYAMIEETVMASIPSFLEADGVPEFSITDEKYAGLVRQVTDRGGTAPVDDYTEAFKAAIADASAVGTGAKVVVPYVEGGSNVYYSGAIRLLSNVNLVISENTTVRFLKFMTNEYYPVVLSGFEGQDLYNFSPFVYALNQKNIAITGKGTLDGQATTGTNGAWNANFGTAQKLPLNADSDRNVPVVKRIYTDNSGNVPETIPVIDGDGVKDVPLPADAIIRPWQGLRPSFIQPTFCENIIIRDVKIRNSPMWEINPISCRNLLVDGADIDSHFGNNDGCNPESTQFVIIQNVKFSTGDDCIAIKSDKNGDGLRKNEPSQYIIVRNCNFADGHGGVTCGSEISGGIKWVFAEDNNFDSPNLQYPLRFKMNSFRGASIENIYERNSVINKSSTAVLYSESSYTSGNAQDQRGDIGRYTPRINNVYISGFKTAGGAESGNINATNFIRQTAYTRAPINGIHIKDSEFYGVGASTVENIAGWELINVKTSARGAGNAVTTLNSTPLRVTGVKISDGESEVSLKDTLTYGNNSVSVVGRTGTGYTVTGRVETASETAPAVRIYTSRSKTAYASASVAAADGGYSFTASITVPEAENAYFINVVAGIGGISNSNVNQTTAVHNVAFAERLTIGVADGAASAKYRNLSEKSEGVRLVIAEYDGDRLTAMNVQGATLAPGLGASVSVAAGGAPGRAYRAFVWDADTLAPLCGPAELAG